MIHARNQQVLLIIYHLLVSCLANFSYIAWDQKCNSGYSKMCEAQEQTSPGISQAGRQL